MAGKTTAGKGREEKTLVIVESPAKSKTIGKILGSNYLIKNGAGIVVEANDLLNCMNWEFLIQENQALEFELTSTQKQVYDIISFEPKTFDEIALNIQINVSDIMVILTELEINGLIKQSNNKYYRCK